MVNNKNSVNGSLYKMMVFQLQLTTLTSLFIYMSLNLIKMWYKILFFRISNISLAHQTFKSKSLDATTHDYILKRFHLIK